MSVDVRSALYFYVMIYCVVYYKREQAKDICP